MTAAELRALAKDVGCEYWPNDGIDRFAQAAEIIDLLAWAEGEQIEIQKAMNGVHVVIGWGPLEFHGDTLIDTLRRAREASK